MKGQKWTFISATTVLLVLLFLVLLLGGGCAKVNRQQVLTITVEGAGTTLPAPGQHYYNKDAFVQLQAIPDQYGAFSHWAGRDADSVTTENKIFMHSDKSITAVFTVLAHPLNISCDPIGSGQVQVDLVTDPGASDPRHYH